MKSASLGERVAEKFYDVASTDPETLQRLAALIDLELKNLGDETQPAVELSNAETGEGFYLELPNTRAFRNREEYTAAEQMSVKLRCPYCGTTEQAKDHTDTCPVGGIETKRVALTSTRSMKPMLPKEKQNPDPLPLIEALRTIQDNAPRFTVSFPEPTEGYDIWLHDYIAQVLKAALAGQDTEEENL